MADYNMGAEGMVVDGVLLGGWGIPTLFGNTAGIGSGRRYYVNPTNGINSNDGLSMDKPKATIKNAYDQTTSNNHDLIILSASSGHSATSDGELAVSNSRTHFMGLDAVARYVGQRSRWTMGVTTGTAIAIVQNTGVGNSWVNIKFDSSDTLSTSLYAFADGGEYTRLSYCEIVKSTLLSDTGRAYLLCNGDSAHYDHCWIGSLVYQVTAKNTCMLLNRETISGKVARDVIVEDCIFALNTTSSDASMIHGNGATDVERMLYLKNCGFINALLSTADPDQAVEFDSNPTEGDIIADNCWSSKCSAFSTTTGVWSATAVKSATGPEVIQSS